MLCKMHETYKYRYVLQYNITFTIRLFAICTLWKCFKLRLLSNICLNENNFIRLICTEYVLLLFIDCWKKNRKTKTHTHVDIDEIYSSYKYILCACIRSIFYFFYCFFMHIQNIFPYVSYKYNPLFDTWV